MEGMICLVFKNVLKTNKHIKSSRMNCFWGRKQEVDLHEVPFFSFEKIETVADVVKVYDGDTVHIVIHYKGEYIKLKTRLDGIDTPELRIAEQKEAGLSAKKRLEEILGNDNNKVKVKLGKFDKYGRVLITLYTSSGVSVNQMLIDEGHAYKYDGGTKKS